MAEGEYATPAHRDELVTSVEWITSDMAIVAVSGEIDVLTAPAMTRGIDATLDKHPAVLVVDLTGASFFASAGLGALVAAEHRSGESCALRIVAPSVVTRRTLRMTGLDQVLAVFSSRDEALAD